MVVMTVSCQLKAPHSRRRVTVYRTRFPKQAELHGVVATCKEPLPGSLVRPLFPTSLDDVSDQVDAEGLAEDALVGILPHWLAAMFLYDSAPSSSGGEFIVDTLEHQKGNNGKEQQWQWQW
jgi:hypothetical protein